VSLLLVAAIVMLTASQHSISEFGLSLVAVPMIASYLGAEVAVVGTSVLVQLLTICSQPAWVQTHVGERILGVAIGSTVILLTILFMDGATSPDRAGVDVVAGFAGGLLATSTRDKRSPVGLGPPGTGISPGEFRATLSVAFVRQGISALAGFVIAPQFTVESCQCGGRRRSRPRGLSGQQRPRPENIGVN
jgi:hypothetical protein